MATTDEMRTCRTLGHNWYPIEANRKLKFGFIMSLQCDRCSTRRDDLVDIHGSLMSRHYDYAIGYRDAEISEGTKDDKRAWLLKELLNRQKTLGPVVDLDKRRKKRA